MTELERSEISKLVDAKDGLLLEVVQALNGAKTVLENRHALLFLGRRYIVLRILGLRISSQTKKQESSDMT